MEKNGVVLSPDPRLRAECAPVETIDSGVKRLVKRMKRIMFDTGGCGLAAPQVGELVQVVIIDTDYTDKHDYDPVVLINPVVLETSETTRPFSEGCLSIPGISCEIERPDHVVVEALDLDGQTVRYEAAEDLMCVCLQHEIDHLHGRTMFERMGPIERLHAMRAYQDALEHGAAPGQTDVGEGA